MNASKTIILHEQDSVAILPFGAEKGEDPMDIGASLGSPILPGHKIARLVHKVGDRVIKFGQEIGIATGDIAIGDHVHSHNCAFSDHGQDYQIGQDLDDAKRAVPHLPERTFKGYRRANGDVATRNYIALVGTVNCSATVIRHAAQEINASALLADYPNVDGVVAFAHGSGCGMSNQGRGMEILERTLWGHATHPNVGAAIFVGLGCEVLQMARMKAAFDVDDKASLADFHSLLIQESGGTRQTIDAIKAKVAELVPQVNDVQREPCPVSSLRVALQCGGSDGLSGITANPALGVATDLLVGLGGTAILSETPEIYGAEQLLLKRARSEDVAQNLINQIKWWEQYVEINGGSLDNNPSPGNKAGGLTTILEKSLGAVAKAGATPLNAVYDYAEKVTAPGLVFMDTPGYDPVCGTGQIASGAHLVVFTTGRGSAYGSKPAPTLKLASNDALFARMPDDMDLNCGDILSQGVPVAHKGKEILERIVEAASGQKTKSEALGLGDHEFLPWQVGAVM